MTFRLTYKMVPRAVLAALVIATLLTVQFLTASMAMAGCNDGPASAMASHHEMATSQMSDMSARVDEHTDQGQRPDNDCDYNCQFMCLSACGNLAWAVVSPDGSGFHKPLHTLKTGPAPAAQAEVPVEFDTPPPRV